MLGSLSQHRHEVKERPQVDALLPDSANILVTEVDHAVLKRFASERQSLAIMDHPSVVRIDQFRYSDLLRVFSVLMRKGWLKKEDLVGLQADKIAGIKRGAE